MGPLAARNTKVGMKLGKGVPSVWPGYVAAVASLVLSLLLLLAILVFAMTQIENLLNEVEVKDDKSTTRRSANSNSIWKNYFLITDYIRLSLILLTCIIMLIAIIVARINQSTVRYFIKPSLPIYRNLA
jgi:hypothetical protein